MLKRILFVLMTFLLLYSAALVGYKVFEPHTDETHTYNLDVLDYDTIKDYTLNSGQTATHYYFFCDQTDADCIYVQNTVIYSTALETELNLRDLIEYVDLSQVVQETRIPRLREDWGLTTYPAFLACHLEDKKIVVDNTLEWNHEQPISNDNLISWLRLNNLYDGDLIEMPIAQPNN